MSFVKRQPVKNLRKSQAARVVGAFAALGCLVFTAQAQAATKSWTGATGAANSTIDWGTTPATNWSPAGFPADGDDIIINDQGAAGRCRANSSPRASYSFASMQVTAGSRFQMDNGTSNSDITITGDLTIASTGSITYNSANANADLTVNGNFTNNGVFDQQNNAGYVYLGGTNKTFKPTGDGGTDVRKVIINGSYNLSGNWNLTNGSNTDLTINGSLDAGTNTVRLGEWFFGSGTFDIDQATIEWSSTTPLPANVTFYNLTIDALTSLSGNLKVTNNLTITTNGRISTGNFNIDVDGTLDVVRSSGIDGNWSAITIGRSLVTPLAVAAARITGTNASRTITFDTPAGGPDSIRSVGVDLLNVVKIVNVAGNTLQPDGVFIIKAAVDNLGTISTSGSTTSIQINGAYSGLSGSTMNTGTVGATFQGNFFLLGTAAFTGTTTGVTFSGASATNWSVASTATYTPASTAFASNRAWALLANSVIDSGDVTFSIAGAVLNTGPYTFDASAVSCISNGGVNAAGFTINNASGVVRCKNVNFARQNGFNFTANGNVYIGPGTWTQSNILPNTTNGTFHLNAVTWTQGAAYTLPSLNVTGSCSMSGAALDVNADLTINNGATLNIGALNATVARNFTNNGTLTTSGTVTMDSNLAATLSGTRTTLVINKANNADTVTLAGDTTISTTFTLTRGVLVTSNYVFTGASITSSANSSVTVSSGGEFRGSNAMALTGPISVAGGGTVRFAGGTTNTMVNVTATGSGSSRATFSRIGGSGGSGFFRLTVSGTVNIVGADFNYLADGGSNTGGLTLTGSPGTGAPDGGLSTTMFYRGQSGLTYLRIQGNSFNGRTFDGLGFHNPATGLGLTVNSASGDPAFQPTDGGTNRTVHNGGSQAITMTNFSAGAAFFYGASTSTGTTTNWGTTDADIVSLAATGSRATGLVNVEWVTASESNNLGFTVLRSAAPNGPFEVVSGLIPGMGTTPVGKAYSFTDLLGAGGPEVQAAAAQGGDVYYQVQDMEFSGETKTHGPIRVQWTDAPALPVANDDQSQGAPRAAPAGLAAATRAMPGLSAAPASVASVAAVAAPAGSTLSANGSSIATRLAGDVWTFERGTAGRQALTDVKAAPGTVAFETSHTRLQAARVAVEIDLGTLPVTGPVQPGGPAAVVVEINGQPVASVDRVDATAPVRFELPRETFKAGSAETAQSAEVRLVDGEGRVLTTTRIERVRLLTNP
jgi:hypothetical protein